MVTLLFCFRLAARAATGIGRGYLHQEDDQGEQGGQRDVAVKFESEQSDFLEGCFHGFYPFVVRKRS